MDYREIAFPEIKFVVLLQAEQFSSLHLVDLLVLVPLALIWAVLPEAAAVIAHWLSGYFTKVLFQLPFSRALEAEADEIGLQLTAKVSKLAIRLLFFVHIITVTF